MAAVLAYLRQSVTGELVVAAALHPAVDAPILRRVAKESRGDMPLPVLASREDVERLFAGSAGKRVVIFGHIEGTSPTTAAFVIHDRQGAAVRIPLADIRAIGAKHRVMPFILGCRSYAAGAGAGVLKEIRAAEIPGIVAAMRRAATNGAFIAAQAGAERPVYIDPDRFMSDVAAGLVVIAATDEDRPRMLLLSPPSNDADPTERETGGPLGGAANLAQSMLQWALIVLCGCAALAKPVARIVLLFLRPGNIVWRHRRDLRYAAGIFTKEGSWGEVLLACELMFVVLLATLGGPSLVDLARGDLAHADEWLYALPLALLYLSKFVTGPILARQRP